VADVVEAVDGRLNIYPRTLTHTRTRTSLARLTELSARPKAEAMPRT
jgi:hypothetical protein